MSSHTRYGERGTGSIWGRQGGGRGEVGDGDRLDCGGNREKGEGAGAHVDHLSVGWMFAEISGRF